MEEGMCYRSMLTNVISYIRDVRENDSKNFDLDEFIVEMMLLGKVDKLINLENN